MSSLGLRTLILFDQGPNLMTAFNCDYFLRGPVSNTATLEIRALTYEFGVLGVGEGGHTNIWSIMFN